MLPKFTSMNGFNEIAHKQALLVTPLWKLMLITIYHFALFISYDLPQNNHNNTLLGKLLSKVTLLLGNWE